MISHVTYYFLKKEAMSVTLKIHSHNQDWSKMQRKIGTVWYLVAKESKAKVLIVGKKKEFEANDHNISRLSLIVDFNLVHFMLK